MSHSVKTKKNVRIIKGGPVKKSAWLTNVDYLVEAVEALKLLSPQTTLTLKGRSYRIVSPIPKNAAKAALHKEACYAVDRDIPGPWAGGPA